MVLLDTDVDQNHPDDRAITDDLYGGDVLYRLKQEAILGIGAARILRALGVYLGDACFVMMTPVSQEMGSPVNPVRFIIALGIAVESVIRLLELTTVAFGQATFVAFLG